MSSSNINRHKSRKYDITRSERKSSLDSRNNSRVYTHTDRRYRYRESHNAIDDNVGPRSRTNSNLPPIERHTNRYRSRSPVRSDNSHDRSSRNFNKGQTKDFLKHHRQNSGNSHYNNNESDKPLTSQDTDEAWDWSTGKLEVKAENDSEQVTNGDENSLEDKTNPNFKKSGKLTAETNTFKGVVIKYSEPPEARKPNIRWRLYPFKGDESLPVLYIHRQSAYLIGRDRLIADFPINHPSCSKQHAVFQYRLVQMEKPDGSKVNVIKPYIIDLGSANGTYINNKRIEPERYIELKQADMIKFGYSTREYILLNENSNAEQLGLDHATDAVSESPASNGED